MGYNLTTKEKVAKDVQEQHERYIPVRGARSIGLGDVIEIDRNGHITLCTSLFNYTDFSWVQQVISRPLQIPFRRIGKAVSAFSVVQGNTSDSEPILRIDGIENRDNTNEKADSAEVRKGKIMCEFTEDFSYVIEMENVDQSEIDEDTSAAFIDELGKDEFLVTGVVRVSECGTSKAACIVTKGNRARFTIETSYTPKLHGVFYGAAKSNEIENTFDFQTYGPNCTVLIKVTNYAHLKKYLQDEAIKKRVDRKIAEAKAKEASSGLFNGLRKSFLSYFSSGSNTSNALEPAAMAAPGASLEEIKAHLVEPSGASLEEIKAHLFEPNEMKALLLGEKLHADESLEKVQDDIISEKKVSECDPGREIVTISISFQMLKLSDIY
mmetsp:Transcript_10911/g.13527  ORF Transcript_10911/g.13527 Transcript_10911/m.13527 type:complete len:381 (-) Transcript_10911:737-1879(-)